MAGRKWRSECVKMAGRKWRSECVDAKLGGELRTCERAV
jgi:hypothetical protein